MQIGEFLDEIENLYSSSKEANDTAKQSDEKGVKQPWSSAMILDLHL